MIEVIFKIFLTDYIDFQGFITKRVQKPFLIEYNSSEKYSRIYVPITAMDVDCKYNKKGGRRNQPKTKIYYD
jgi:hypothetical protein